jgi:hypothetical protein
LRLIADRTSCCLSNRAYKLKGVNLTEVLVIFAGSWDHNVWYGVHVCPRWTGTPKVSCRAYCRRSLPPKGCSCTSGTSFNSLNFCFVLISYVQLSTWTVLVPHLNMLLLGFHVLIVCFGWVPASSCRSFRWRTIRTFSRSSGKSHL